MNRLAFGREPALWLGLVQTVLALVVSFGLDLSAPQIGGILAASAAVLSIVVRQTVYAPQSPSLVSSGPGGTPRGGGQPDPQAPAAPPDVVPAPPAAPPAAPAPPVPAPDPLANLKPDIVVPPHASFNG